MIKVCHITTSHTANDTRIFQRECRGLARSGYDVTLVAPDAADGQTIDGVRLRSLPKLNRLGRKFILPRAAMAIAHSLQPDLYHFHDPGLLPWAFALARRHKVKVIWDAHELYTATMKEFHFHAFPPLGALASLCFDKLERRCCAAFAGVVTVTEPIAARYATWGLPVEVIKNVIDLDNLPPVRRGKNSSVFTILASGTTNESRRVKQLIDAFALVRRRVPNCCLRLLAYYDTHLEERELRDYIHQRGLSGNVRISPLVSWERLMAEEIPYANLAVVFYARSKNNLVALPNRLFEYWARKLPVVATDTEILRGVVEANAAGQLVDSDSPAAIAAAILRYYDNPAEAVQAGENGYRVVAERYNWGVELEKLKSFYETVLSSGEGVPP